MSEILRMANEVVAAETARLEFYESCIVVHTLDQLTERALQMIEKRMPQAEITQLANLIERWTEFAVGSRESLANLGTGPDEELEWEIDDAWKQHDREQKSKGRSNNMSDGYQL